MFLLTSTVQTLDAAAPGAHGGARAALAAYRFMLVGADAVSTDAGAKRNASTSSAPFPSDFLASIALTSFAKSTPSISSNVFGRGGGAGLGTASSCAFGKGERGAAGPFPFPFVEASFASFNRLRTLA